MGRRRRKIPKPYKRSLPNVFICPKCGQISVRAWYEEPDMVRVVCGNVECGFRFEHVYERRPEVIDVYNMAVDKYNRGEI
jgi:transcription elongation factor Elf1